jgi:nucleotide-binding universal stress UspA family protein
MKILVPTDFSKNARHAVNYATMLAKVFMAEVELLNVYTPAVTRNNLNYPLIQEETKKAVIEADKKLNEICIEMTESQGIQCKIHVLTGNMVEEVIRIAKESKIDLIVMGTMGASGISKILFGSNTASVIENASCPVLAIPVSVKIELPKKVIYATNYYNSDMKTMKSLTKIVKTLNAELTILHVSREKLKSERDLIEQFSKTVAKETDFQQPFFYVMPHEDTQKGIELFVESTEADLLAVATRKRSVFEKLFNSSLTKKMAYQSRLPLLAFQAEDVSQDFSSDDF